MDFHQILARLFQHLPRWFRFHESSYKFREDVHTDTGLLSRNLSYVTINKKKLLNTIWIQCIHPVMTSFQFLMRNKTLNPKP